MSEHGGCEKCLHINERVLRKTILKNGHVRRRLQCVLCGNRRYVYEISAHDYALLDMALRNLAEHDKMHT